MERRLAAIMALDMVGYSRLMAADETGTLLRHKAHRRDVIDPAVARFEGRVVKAIGDGLLAEFQSVVHAVRCAAEVQRAIHELESEVAEDRRIQYRIGINLGDIILEDGDIFGDGVNLASRIEALADAGGICISDLVYQNVKTKLDLVFEPLGSQAFKNIPEKVQVYRFRSPHANRASSYLSRAAGKPQLPAKPSVAVLPFANMSSHPEHGFFADGITEDIITALSRVRELFVISRNTSFVYKGRSVRLEDVARELGVGFILEGSIRVAGNRVRVTAQLINGLSGNHLWAERYDGNLDDIFAVQDEITRSIALALQVKLTYGELARLWEGQTRDLRAWEKMVLARDLFLRFTVAANREARGLLEEAIAMDPSYTGAMVQLGFCHWVDARFAFSPDKEHSLRLAEQQVAGALKLNPEIGSPYMLRGGIHFLRDQHDEAVALCEKAIEFAPGDSWAQGFLGMVYIYAGEAKRGLEAVRTAIRLSPYHPSWYTYYLSMGNLWAGDFPSAKEAAEAYLLQEPEDPYAYTNLAMVYGFQEQIAEAARIVAELRTRSPAFTIKDVVLSQRYKDPGMLDRVLEVLRQAGLPG